MRVLHAADIHLDSPLIGLAAKSGDRASELVGATRRAFTAMVDYAIQAEVAVVLIAGDLYDGDWRDFSTGLFFMSEMARLERAGVRVAVVKGNHDAENQMTRSLRLPANTRVFRSDRPETWILEDLGVALHGRSFPTRDVTDNISANYPQPVWGMLNIGLLHTAADGKYGHAPYAPCTVADLAAKEYDYWALGHVHTRRILSEKPWIVFPGNLQGRHANETGIKGATLITVDDRSVVSVEHIPLDVVRWAQVSVELSDCADYEAGCHRIREQLTEVGSKCEGRTLAVRLNLTGKTNVHRRLAGDLEQTNAECLAIAEQSGEDVWLERVVIGTEEPDSKAASDADALSELFKTVEEIRNDPEAIQIIRAELQQALTRMPAKAKELGNLKELDDEMMGSVLDGAAVTLRHRLSLPLGEIAHAP